ncbi:MAG: hypothetical protein J0H34_13965 [Rhizobiales bacterium]|nr:hypothetical protein [Hyphomicrobiales bacterium]
MTRILLLAAFAGGIASSAAACEWQKSVEAKTDPTVVASIAKNEASLSTVEDAKAATDAVVRQKTE